MSTAANRLSTFFGLQDPRLQSPCMPMVTPVIINTPANVTYTPAQLMAGMILRDCGAAARSDTVPSAANLCNQIQGCMVGTSFQWELRNTTAGAFAVTLLAAAGSGVTLSPVGTSVAQAGTRTYMVVFTNVTPGSEAYTLYALAAGTF